MYKPIVLELNMIWHRWPRYFWNRTSYTPAQGFWYWYQWPFRPAGSTVRYGSIPDRTDANRNKERKETERKREKEKEIERGGGRKKRREGKESEGPLDGLWLAVGRRSQRAAPQAWNRGDASVLPIFLKNKKLSEADKFFKNLSEAGKPFAGFTI